MNMFSHSIVLLLLAISFASGYLIVKPSVYVKANLKRTCRNINPPTPPSHYHGVLFNGDDSNENATSDTIANLSNENIKNPVLKYWSSLSDDQKEDVKTTVISLVFAIILRIFIIEPRYIPSLSMYPTFDIGDQLLVDKVSHFNRGYKKRDVVVFNPSETYTELTGNKEALIKRIVGVAGDTIEVNNFKVYVNGIGQLEPYTNEDPDYYLSPITIPAGYVLVLGDNRNHSFDSHIWGLLPEKNIIGRAVVKYWPPWRAGIVEGSD